MFAKKQTQNKVNIKWNNLLNISYYVQRDLNVWYEMKGHLKMQQFASSYLTPPPQICFVH